jgi:hypothetical protein
MLDAYLKRVTIDNRKGVITTGEIGANIPICEFQGKIITFKELPSLEKPEDALQIGPNIYISPSNYIANYIRHSCTPNCIIHVVGIRAIVYSMYVIRKDSEITFDYSASSTETPDTWDMLCNCGSSNCRKNISGFYNLDKNKQDEYNKKGISALFINSPIFQKK